MTGGKRPARRRDERGEHGVTPEQARPDRFRWIVDGHNAIFAMPEWEQLQLSGDKRQARLGLERSLEDFGRAIGSQIWVVYDGNEMERNPDAVVWPHLRTEYSLPPEEADDRIRFLVRKALQDGEHPVVVSSDRRTLASSLPAGVRTLAVRDFYARVHARLLRRPEKWNPRGLEDVERFFLSRSPYEDDRLAGEDGRDGTASNEDLGDA